jgi:high-affinity iron transporter
VSRVPSLRRPNPLLLAILAAAVVATIAFALAPGHDHPPHVAGIADPGVAPAPSARHQGPLGHVNASRLDAQAAADAAMQTPTADGLRPEVQPLSPRDFHAPVRSYRRYAIGQARAMAVAVTALVGALRAGNRGTARAAWMRAYDRYLRLGAAYGALGDLDTAIDGSPGGLARGVGDPHFTGLHRIEHDLWTGRPTAAIVPYAQRLRSDVALLPRTLARMEISPLDYATRAHEILEDAQRDQLSGAAAPWSDAGVFATAADLAATRVVIGTLRPLLSGRGNALPPVQFQLRAFAARLAAIRRAHGGRLPAQSALRPREREALDGGLGALLEALSGVPGDLETQLPPAVPAIPKGGK